MRSHQLALRMCLLVIASSPAYATNPCERAGKEAERVHNLPPGLLSAVGQVESGRWDAETNQRVAWPWTINVAGEGRQFASAEEAMRETSALLAKGAGNVDVGCFQISLQYHPKAFASLDEAFDPTTNALYAGRFLASLKERLGSWKDAVAAYHSADAARGTPYREMVYANWTSPGGNHAEPVIAFGIRIWTPSAAGMAPAVITMGSAGASIAPLPHVITMRR